MGRLIYTPGPDIKFRTGVIGKVTDEPEKTVSGAIASFDDGADNKPLHALSVSIEPVQTGTGDPSPENVRPISGWSEAKIWNDPKYGGNIVWNQLFKWQTTTTSKGVTLTQNGDGSLTLTGSNTDNYNNYFSELTGYIPTGHVYLIGNPNTDNSGGGGSTGTYNLFCRYKNAGSSFTKAYKGSTPRIIKPSNATYPSWRLEIQYGNSSAGVTFNDTFFPYCFDLTMMFGEEIADQLLAMETAEPGAGVAWFRNLFPKEWYPYNAGELTCVSAVNEDPYQQLTVGLGEERYGGTLDVLTGVLTATHQIIDLGSLTWIKPETWDGWRTNDLQIMPGITAPSDFYAEKYKSEYYETIKSSAYQGYGLAIGSSEKPTRIYTSDPDGVKPTGNLVFPMPNPRTVSLAPQQMNTLLGENHIWADTGDVAVTYPVSVRIPVIIRGVNDQEGEEADENDQ